MNIKHARVCKCVAGKHVTTVKWYMFSDIPIETHEEYCSVIAIPSFLIRKPPPYGYTANEMWSKGLICEEIAISIVEGVGCVGCCC